MRPRPSRAPQHACPRPRHDARADEPAQTGDCAHMPSIQRPCGRQQPAFRRRTPRGQPAGHAPRADPLRRRRHHDRRGDGTACRRSPGFPAHRRHQIHATRFPRDAAHRHGVRGRMPAIDPRVPAAFAVRGICGRRGGTIHVGILFKGAVAASLPVPGSPLNQVCGTSSRIRPQHVCVRPSARHTRTGAPASRYSRLPPPAKTA